MKSNFFNSKIRLSHRLVSFQNEQTTFLHSSTHLQVNKKNYIQNKIKLLSLLIKMAKLYLEGKELLVEKNKDFSSL